MSVHRRDNNTWQVRWRSDGRQRSRTFDRKADAVTFDRARRDAAARDVAIADHIAALAEFGADRADVDTATERAHVRDRITAAVWAAVMEDDR